MKRCYIYILLLITLTFVSCKFHYVPEEMTWSEAKAYCRERYTDIATITDEEDMEILNELGFVLNISSRVWIGLHNKAHDWAQEFDSFINNSDYNMVIYGPNGDWVGHSPRSKQLYSICRKASQTKSHGFDYIRHGSNWLEAQRHCQANHGLLATVKNQEEKNYLRRSIGTTYVWMNPYGTGWQWADGTKVQDHQYINWLSPKLQYLRSERRCVASQQTLESSGGWETQDCSNRLPSFCFSRTNVKIVKVRLEFDSRVPYNTKEFQDDMLQQIKRRLKQGMGVRELGENIRVSWRKQKDGQVFQEVKKRKNGDQRRHGEL